MKVTTKILWGGGIVVVLGILWYLFSPLLITQEVNESLPNTTSISTQENSESTNDLSERQGRDATVESTISVEVEPVSLFSGSFEDVDFIHKGMGNAIIYKLADGSQVLRFEDFEVTNGPDLHVILSTHERPRNETETKQEGFIDLGSLKGNKGNQNYILPENFTLDEIKSVVIYCYPFNVVFSTAALQ
jgi:hypothetical protein